MSKIWDTATQDSDFRSGNGRSWLGPCSVKCFSDSKWIITNYCREEHREAELSARVWGKLAALIQMTNGSFPQYFRKIIVPSGKQCHSCNRVSRPRMCSNSFCAEFIAVNRFILEFIIYLFKTSWDLEHCTRAAWICIKWALSWSFYYRYYTRSVPVPLYKIIIRELRIKINFIRTGSFILQPCAVTSLL